MSVTKDRMVSDNKYDRLVELIRELGPPAVAFSGGVDSSLVAAAAFQAHGTKALAVTLVSELISGAEEQDACWVAKAIGVRHEILRLSLLGEETVVSNTPDRCYYCKRLVFAAVGRLAERDGLAVVLDGSNADDALTHRPGMRALGELGVVSPLMKLGYGKSDVRAMAKEAGVVSFKKPSMPCLATRFPYGERLTDEGLARVRAAEEYLKVIGLKVYRVRDHGGLARVEVAVEDIPKVAGRGLGQKIVAKLKSLGYNYVSLDLEGYRSGSMDVVVREPGDKQV